MALLKGILLPEDVLLWNLLFLCYRQSLCPGQQNRQCLRLNAHNSHLRFYIIILLFQDSPGDLRSLTRDGALDHQQWKLRVLTTGPPGKSLLVIFFNAHH